MSLGGRVEMDGGQVVVCKWGERHSNTTREDTRSSITYTNIYHITNHPSTPSIITQDSHPSFFPVCSNACIPACMRKHVQTIGNRGNKGY